MPYATGKPKTTTERPRPFIAELPTLESRIMERGGRDALEIIAKRERAFSPAVPRDLYRVCGKISAYAVASGLCDLGLVSIGSGEFGGYTKHMTYRLTDAGWRVVGGKPFWMEGAA